MYLFQVMMEQNLLNHQMLEQQKQVMMDPNNTQPQQQQQQMNDQQQVRTTIKVAVRITRTEFYILPSCS